MNQKREKEQYVITKEKETGFPALLSSDSLYYLQFCNKLKCDKSELIGLDDFSQGHFRIPETGIRVFVLY